MPKRSTTTLLATTAVSLGIASPAAAAGPPPGTIASQCDGGRTVLVIRGEAVAVLPGTCENTPGRHKWGEITL